MITSIDVKPVKGTTMLLMHLWVRLQSARRPEAGQASVEYALVLLGAAVVASLLIAWASKTKLLDDLFDHVLGLVKGKAQ